MPGTRKGGGVGFAPYKKIKTFMQHSQSLNVPSNTQSVRRFLFLQVVGGLIPIDPDLEADAALEDAMRGPDPGPHIAEPISGDGLYAAEVRGRDLQVEIRVV
jgi:hypothetical protein